MRRFLGVLGVTALLAASALPVDARQPGSVLEVTPLTATRMIDGTKSLSGSLAKSDPELLARTDSQMINILVKMDVDAVASYQGDVQGLAATSPSTTGKAVKDNNAAVSAYKGYLELRATGIRREAQRVVPSIQFGRTFLIAYGGFGARLPANQAKELLKIKGVAAVQYDSVNKITANDSPNFVGASAVWPSLGGESHAGQGVVLGVLDTGIWPEHPMFADPGIPNPGGGPYGCEFGLSGDAHDPAFACNDKLIGAYAFLDTNLLVTGPGLPGEYCPDLAHCSARDADGHGTHTSSTAAGSPVDHSVLLGVDRGHISGIAPGASVIMYRVCDSDGCYSTDSMAAVEQAITDGVDVINFSISGGSSAYTDGVELAFLDAYAAGIEVNASAGNAGPGAGTSDHAGPWTNTIGASTLDREFGSTLHLTADGGATLDVSGATVTAGVTSPTPVVLASAAPYSHVLCDSAAAGGTFTGKVVVCERGVNARIEKGYNVSLGGAAGMVLFNAGPTDLETDNHFLPAIHVNDAGLTINAFVTGHTNVMATWAAGTAGPAQGDVMASFSSRGPVGDFIKPDVTAPGVQILAGESPHHLFSPADGLGPNGEFYQAIAGTSMSSPHAAGVALLIRAAHPSWTAGEVKSAMMTSSVQDVVKEDGSTPADPFDMGAGSIRANTAVGPTVLFDVNPEDYFASADDPFSRINLNVPSINAPSMNGIITTRRTARNATGVQQTLDLSATAPSGVKITLTPKKLVLGAYQAASFEIKIDATKKADGQYFGEITLNPRAAGANNAVLPVAFYKQPGEVTLSNTCDSTSRVKGTEANCQISATNFANSPANVTVGVNAPNTGRLIINDWSAGRKKGNGFQWSGQLSPALAPQILSLTSPGYGYLSLPGLGVPPEIGYGDETIGTYEGLPAFQWAGELYDSFGVDSNGYVVVGPAEVADNNCCDPQMPDPAQPNNVLAPYWTDLNPATHGNIYVALLNFGGGLRYLVVEYNQVPIFGTSNYRTTQVWIKTHETAGEDIAFEYCISPNSNPVAGAEDGCSDVAAGLLGPGAVDGLVVGAENRDGSDAATIGPENTQPSNTGYVVHAGAPTAGGTMTIDYDAFGKNTGTFDVAGTMTSDVTQGTAKTIVTINVHN